MSGGDGSGGRGAVLGLAAIAAAALALRLWGVAFGLPFNYHVDESWYVAAATGFSWDEISPLFGPFQILVLAGGRLLELISPLVEALPLSEAAAATLEADASRHRLAGRLVSALLGALTTVPVYLLGRRFWGPRVGLLAAALLAVAFIHARSSHYGTPDATVCFLVACAALASVRLPSPRWRAYLAAGALAGLAVTTKQTSWPVLALPALFHLFGAWAARDGADPPAAPAPPLWRRALSLRLAAGYALALLAILATSPQIALQTEGYYQFWKWAATVGARGGLGRLEIEPEAAWELYLRSLVWGLGAPLMAAAFLGLAWAVARRRPRGFLLLLVFPVLYFAFLLKPGNMYFARYTVMVVPYLVLAAAALLSALAGRLPLGAGGRAAAAAVLAALVAAPPALALVRHDRLLLREDTRTIAKRWVEGHLPEGTTLLLESWWFSPQLASEVRDVPLSTRRYRVLTKGPYGLYEKGNGAGPTAGAAAVSDYAKLGAEYIVTNSLTSDSRMLDPEEDRAKREFYRRLGEEAELVFEVSPYRDGRPIPRIFDHTYGPATHLDRVERSGPVIRIYELEPPPPEPEAPPG